MAKEDIKASVMNGHRANLTRQLSHVSPVLISAWLASCLGAILAMVPDARVATGLLALAICLTIALTLATPRTVASLALYACALSLALPGVRLTNWMSVSDSFLFLGCVLLLPELPNLRVRLRTHRTIFLAVLLIAGGGLLGAMISQDAETSVSNLTRLVVAAGATLATFALWAPDSKELRLFLVLVVASGVITSSWALATSDANFGRTAGLSGHPNALALVSLIAFGPALSFATIPETFRVRLLAGLSAMVLVAGVVVSGSRAGLIGLAASAVISFGVAHTSSVRRQLSAICAILMALALIAATSLTPENAVNRAFNPRLASVSLSDEERHKVFSEMITTIRHHPLTGVGFDDPLGGHDAYLQLWAAGGLLAFLGGLLVISVLVGAVVTLHRTGRVQSTVDRHFALLATTVGLSGLAVALLFQNVLWHRYIWIAVALVASSHDVLTRHQNHSVRQSTIPTSL